MKYGVYVGAEVVQVVFYGFFHFEDYQFYPLFFASSLNSSVIGSLLYLPVPITRVLQSQGGINGGRR